MQTTLIQHVYAIQPDLQKLTVYTDRMDASTGVKTTSISVYTVELYSNTGKPTEWTNNHSVDIHV